MRLTRKFVYHPYQVYRGTASTLGTRTFKSGSIYCSMMYAKLCFRALKIKPCAIREYLHRRKYENHQSVICGTVKPIHGYVMFLPFRSVLLQNSKPDRVLLWTGLRRTKSEQKTPSQKHHLSVTAVHLTENQYH